MLSPSILVVEDDLYAGSTLALLLETCGYEVRTAADGVAALTKIAQRAPDVVITDIVVPKLSGVELCVELRANADTRHIPVVVCSGVAQPPPILAQLGVAYLPKPVDFDALTHIVAALLPGGPMQRAKRRRDDVLDRHAAAPTGSRIARSRTTDGRFACSRPTGEVQGERNRARRCHHPRRPLRAPRVAD